MLKRGISGSVERRYIPNTEMRVKDNNGVSVVEGHAAVFNVWSLDLGWFSERVLPGAFTETIKNDDVRGLWNHNPDYILGRNMAGTLKLYEDKVGLGYELQMPGTTYARDLLESIDRGDVSQNSFGFRTLQDNWFREPGENDTLQERRELVAVQLFDISPVTYPAYPQTDLNIRSVLGAVGLKYEDLTGVLFRAQRGTPLTDGDRELINASIQVLQNYLAKPGDGSEPGGGEERAKTGRLALMRKRLDLLERAI